MSNWINSSNSTIQLLFLQNTWEFWTFFLSHPIDRISLAPQWKCLVWRLFFDQSEASSSIPKTKNDFKFQVFFPSLKQALLFQDKAAGHVASCGPFFHCFRPISYWYVLIVLYQALFSKQNYLPVRQLLILSRFLSKIIYQYQDCVRTRHVYISYIHDSSTTAVFFLSSIVRGAGGQTGARNVKAEVAEAKWIPWCRVYIYIFFFSSGCWRGSGPGAMCLELYITYVRNDVCTTKKLQPAL